MAPAREGGEQAPARAGATDGTPSRRRLWVSRTPGRVVARFRDGGVLKGYADFDPGQPSLTFRSLDRPDGEAIEVRVADLKALFFVRSFDGAPDYEESKDLYQARPPGTRKVLVEFVDGEELVGHTRGNPSTEPGFFFTPLDRESNNLRVFAVGAAIRRVERRL